MKYKLLIALFAVTTSLHAQSKKWSLRDCVDYAIENNISLNQQRLNKELSEEDIKAAKGNFLPDLGAQATQNWDFGYSIGVVGTGTNRDRRSNTFGLSTNMNLYNGNQNRNQLKRNKLALNSNQFQLDILVDDITIQILSGYIDILAQKENLKIAQEQVKISKENVSQVEEFVNAGSRPRAELYDVKSQLASDQENLVRAESQLTMSKIALTEILQIPYLDFDIETVDVDISTIDLLFDNPTEIYDTAVQNRAEIMKAMNDMEQSEIEIAMAKGVYYPTLSFGANAFTQYQHFQGVPDDDDNPFQQTFGKQLNNNLNYNIGFTLRVPIFNRNQSKVNVNKSKINYMMSENELAQQKQNLLSNVVRVFNDARNSLNQYKASEASLEAQEEAFKNAEVSFKNGVMTSFEFEQVRLRLINAQSTFVNSKYDFIFRSKALEYYTGVPIAE